MNYSLYCIWTDYNMYGQVFYVQILANVCPDLILVLDGLQYVWADFLMCKF